MYIIGGWDRVSHFGEVQRLDLDKFIWSQEKIDINLKVAQQTVVLTDDLSMVMFGGKTNKEDGEEMAASPDMIVTRLSALSANPGVLKQIPSDSLTAASIHS